MSNSDNHDPNHETERENDEKPGEQAPYVIETTTTGEVQDAFSRRVRVQWSVTIECECGEDVELSSLYPVKQCESCAAQWEARSALSGRL